MPKPKQSLFCTYRARPIWVDDLHFAKRKLALRRDDPAVLYLLKEKRSKDTKKGFPFGIQIFDPQKSTGIPLNPTYKNFNF